MARQSLLVRGGQFLPLQEKIESVKKMETVIFTENERDVIERIPTHCFINWRKANLPPHTVMSLVKRGILLPDSKKKVTMVKRAL